MGSTAFDFAYAPISCPIVLSNLELASGEPGYTLSVASATSVMGAVNGMDGGDEEDVSASSSSPDVIAGRRCVVMSLNGASGSFAVGDFGDALSLDFGLGVGGDPDSDLKKSCSMSLVVGM